MKIVLGCLLLVFYFLLRKQQKRKVAVPPPAKPVLKLPSPPVQVKVPLEELKEIPPSSVMIELPKIRKEKPRSRLARLLLAKEILERRD